MAAASQLPTPPMDTVEELPKAGVILGDCAQAQLKVMIDEGLNELLFLPFINEDPMLEWPTGALLEFFDKQYTLHRDELDHAVADVHYFELLGIKHGKAEYFASEYPEWGLYGWLPIQLVTWYYETLARKEARKRRNHLRQQFGMMLGPISQIYHDINVDTLYKAQVGTDVAIQVSASRVNITDEPVFAPMNVQKLSELPEGPEYLYHSTSLENAISIAMAGPLVGSPSGRPNDFNGGFYLNADSTAALRWALKSSIAAKDDSAILVYRVEAPERSSWKELRLEDETGVSWEKIVTAFRAQDYSLIDLEGLLEKFDAISGPIARNALDVSQQLATPLPLENFQQVAILSHRLGVRLKHFLVGIMIVTSPQ